MTEYTFEYLLEQFIRWKHSDKCIEYNAFEADDLIDHHFLEQLQHPLDWLKCYLEEDIRKSKRSNTIRVIRRSDSIIDYIIVNYAPEEFIMEWKMRGWIPLKFDSYCCEDFAEFIGDPSLYLKPWGHF